MTPAWQLVLLALHVVHALFTEAGCVSEGWDTVCVVGTVKEGEKKKAEMIQISNIKHMFERQWFHILA